MEMSNDYNSAQHAMQTGVGLDQHHNPETPKATRVGINTALVDHASLVDLLIDKGVITDEEYTNAAIKGMEAEAKRYEDDLAEKTDANIKLH